MTYKDFPRIFVTGYMGAATRELSEQIAAETGYELIDLDAEIEKADGRTIQRICMLMGEHEYRNKEYEMLQSLKNREGIVVLCGDGIIFDDQNREVLADNKVVLADAGTDIDILWERAKDQKGLPYAFMNFGGDERKKQFAELYEQRKEIYRKLAE
jgi:shikimate kinase